jgi:hypothetical protein
MEAASGDEQHYTDRLRLIAQREQECAQREKLVAQREARCAKRELALLEQRSPRAGSPRAGSPRAGSPRARSPRHGMSSAKKKARLARKLKAVAAKSEGGA